MAKIGLNNFRYSGLTEASDGTATYDGAKTPAKAISCTVEITNNEAMLYADDVLSESDTTFNKADITIGIDDDDTATMAYLLGHDYNDTSHEMVRNSADQAPYIGFGRIITKMVGGAYKYKVEALLKVKFSEPSQEDNTKGESVEFATTELNGIASTLANGDWSKTSTFDDKEDAITYLEGLFASGNAPAEPAEPGETTETTNTETTNP